MPTDEERAAYLLLALRAIREELEREDPKGAYRALLIARVSIAAEEAWRMLAEESGD